MHPEQMPTRQNARDHEEEEESLKLRVNNLIWMHSPEKMTLGQADRIACDILGMILMPKLDT